MIPNAKEHVYISDTRLNQAFNNNFSFLNPRFKTVRFRHIYTQTRIKNLLKELGVDFNKTIKEKLSESFESLMLNDPPPLKKGVFDTLSKLSSTYNIGMISVISTIGLYFTAARLAIHVTVIDSKNKMNKATQLIKGTPDRKKKPVVDTAVLIKGIRM